MTGFEKNALLSGLLRRIRPGVECVALLLLLGIVARTFSVSPLNGEDFGLSRFSPGQGWAERFTWIVAATEGQFKAWNARLGELLSIFWLEMPPPLFTVASVLAFSAFTTLIAMLARCSCVFDRRFVSAWLLTVALCWLAWPLLEVFFWRVASAGYLQPFVLTLALVLVLTHEDCRRGLARRPLAVLVVWVVAFLAGMSFENVPPALLLYFAWHLWRMYRRGEREMGFPVIAVLCFAVGWAVLMLAPSTAYRVHFYKETLHSPPWSIGLLELRSVEVLTRFYTSSQVLVSIFMLCGLSALCWRRPLQGRTLAVADLLVPGAITCGGVVLAPYVEPRAFMLLWVAMLVFCVAFLEALVATSPWRAMRLLPLVLALGALYTAQNTYHAYARFGVLAQARLDRIMAHRGQPACTTGLDIPLIRTEESPRVLNNRDPWIASTLKSLHSRFGCNLRITGEVLSK